MHISQPPLASPVSGGEIIICTVAAGPHPDNGVLLAIGEQRTGLLKTSLLVGERLADKEQRRQLLVANPGTKVEVVAWNLERQSDDMPCCMCGERRESGAFIDCDEEFAVFVRQREADGMID